MKKDDAAANHESIFKYQKLHDILPDIQDLVPGNSYIYEFLIQSWAMIMAIKRLSNARCHSEYDNLFDLLDSLSEFIEPLQYKRCHSMLNLVKQYRESRFTIQDTAAILKVIPKSMYIDIFFKSKILSIQLTMDIDCGKYGAFALSQGSDIINLCRILGNKISESSAIDLGSGNGFSTFLLSQFVHDITGIEINEKLYNESLSSHKTLLARDKVEKNCITFTNSDFFATDLSPFALIYIYWPYDVKEKEEYDKEARLKLEEKIIKESKAGTLIVACVSGMTAKCIFPLLTEVNISHYDFHRQIHLYEIG